MSPENQLILEPICQLSLHHQTITFAKIQKLFSIESPHGQGITWAVAELLSVITSNEEWKTTPNGCFDVLDVVTNGSMPLVDSIMFTFWPQGNIQLTTDATLIGLIKMATTAKWFHNIATKPRDTNQYIDQYIDIANINININIGFCQGAISISISIL